MLYSLRDLTRDFFRNKFDLWQRLDLLEARWRSNYPADHKKEIAEAVEAGFGEDPLVKIAAVIVEYEYAAIAELFSSGDKK